MTIQRLISIVDCDLCIALPVREYMSAPPLPDTWTRLSTVATLTLSSDAGDCDEVRVCPSCGTYYHYSQIHDPHFGEPLPPTTDWYLRRITPHYARGLLRHARPQGVSAPSPLESLEERFPTIIELVSRDLARAPNLHIKKYMVDSLYDHFVLKERDWDGLRTTLIEQSDPAVQVYVARLLFEDTEHPFSDSRRDAAKTLLAAEPTRKKLLVAVLANGLSQKGQFLMAFTGAGYEPAGVFGMAMYALRYVVPRRSLGTATSGLIALLQPSSENDWWREAARDLLVGYVGQNRLRAKKILEATAPDTAEALAVREHCQKLLT